MSTRTIRIKPRPGVELAGIPAAGASVPAELADEWIRAGLAVRVKPPATAKSTPAAPATEG